MYRVLRVLVLLVFIAVYLPVSAQETTISTYDTTSFVFQDIQNIITSAMEDIEIDIKKGSMVYPFAVVMLSDLSMEEIHIKDKKQRSNIAAFQEALSIPALKGTYIAIAIFYTDTVVNPNTGVVESTLVITTEHEEDDIAYTYYYPYSIDNKMLVWGDSYGEESKQIMYKP